MGLDILSVEGFRHFTSCIAFIALLLLSGAPAKAQDRPAVPDLAKLTGQPQINEPAEIASLPLTSQVIPNDAGLPPNSPNYVRPAGEPKLSDPVAKLLALPEDKIDIGTAALTFAHEIYPNIDVPEYSKKLDQLAYEARQIAGKDASPDDARKALNAVIYQRERFHYDFSPRAKDEWANFFLPGILDTKKGICGTMPMLYLAVAQRMGLQIYPVAAPQHNFLRITDPRASFPNIEATSGGGSKSDAHYIEEFHITDAALKAGTYMRTLSYHEYLAILLGTNADYYDHKGDYDRAIFYYERALKIDPRSDGAALGLMLVYMRKSRAAESNALHLPKDEFFKAARENLQKSLSYREKVTALGVRWEDYADEENN